MDRHVVRLLTVAVATCFALPSANAVPIPLVFAGADAENAGTGTLWRSRGRPGTDALRVCALPLVPMPLPTSPAPVTLGGDYWITPHASSHSFGHQGTCWFRTDGGELVSPVFRAGRFVSLRARGQGRIELRNVPGAVLASITLPPTAAAVIVFDPMADVSLDLGRTAARVRLVVVPAAGKMVDVDDVRTHATAAPPRVPVTTFRARGSRAWGFADLHVHISSHQAMGGLGGVRTLWGVPGGDVRTYAQDPGAIWKDIPRCNGYDHRLGTRASPWQGFLGAATVGGMMGRAPKAFTLEDVSGLFLHDLGGPNVKRRDHYKDGFHQQHHITAIRRAYDGGLRLMGALANHSEFLELMQGTVIDDGRGRRHVQLTNELALARAHVCFVQELARLNADWMEVANSADDAQRIIASNKLAVVIGIELPDAGHLVAGATAEQEVAELYRIGIRQITIIHGADNTLGGTQIFQDVYDWFTDLLDHGIDARDRVTRSLAVARATKFDGIEHREGGCGAAGSPLRGQRGECVLYTLGKLDLRPVVTTVAELGADMFPAVIAVTTLGAIGVNYYLGVVAPMITPVILALPLVYAAIMLTPLANTPTGLVAPPADFIARIPLMPKRNLDRIVGGHGHLNARSLTPRGRQYVRAMMAHGMVVDLAHASDLSTRAVFEESRAFAARKLGARCRAGDLVADHKKVLQLAQDGAQDCFDESYPLIVSHAQFRAQSLQKLLPDDAAAIDEHLAKPGQLLATTSRDQAPREFEMADHQLRWFRRLGGVVGVFLGQEVIDVPSTQNTGISNNCAHSTATFALGYAYASQMLGGRGVALSSDATFHAMSGPRFGPSACGAHEVSDLERKLTPGFYRTDAQKAAVFYVGVRSLLPVRADQPPMTRYRQDQISFDYNVDGWANYGVVPDLLQDARNLGMTGDMDAVFHSAQDYVDAWAKGERVSGCNGPGGKCADPTPRALDCRATCKGTCPAEPGGTAGAPPEVAAPICGDEGQRACCVLEGFTCRPGLREQNRCTGNCACTVGLGSSIGICKPLTACGGPGQRACCALEGRNCGPGLVEQGSCPAELGDCACHVGGASIGVCKPPRTPCGGLGERACCIREGRLDGEPSCRNGVPEVHPCTGDCRCTNSTVSSWGMCRPQICQRDTDCAPQDVCSQGKCLPASRRCRDNHPEDCSGWACRDNKCVPP